MVGPTCWRVIVRLMPFSVTPSIIGNTLFAEWRLTGNGHEIFTAILDRLLASKELERGFSSGAAEELAAKPLQHRHNLLVGGYDLLWVSRLLKR